MPSTPDSQYCSPLRLPPRAALPAALSLLILPIRSGLSHQPGAGQGAVNEKALLVNECLLWSQVPFPLPRPSFHLLPIQLSFTGLGCKLDTMSSGEYSGGTLRQKHHGGSKCYEPDKQGKCTRANTKQPPLRSPSTGRHIPNSTP